MEEVIARLTGQLKFDVDLTGLRAFQQNLTNISKQMQAIGRQAEAMNAKLSQKLGIKPTDTAAQAKASKSVIASLDRELRLERLVAQARRETFKAELAQSNLKYTGVKSTPFTVDPSLQDQHKQAILAAKQHTQYNIASAKQQLSLEQSKLRVKAAANHIDHAAQQAMLKAQGLSIKNVKASALLTSRAGLAGLQLQVLQERRQHAATQAGIKAQGLTLKNNHSIEAAKARQLRSEKLLQLTQARTQLLQQKQFQSLTATQKIELVMQHARERSQKLSERFQQQQALSHTRAQRQEVKHQQSQQRFKWQQARQQQWEANRNSPRGLNPLSMVQGLSGGAAGLAAFGGIGAALAALTIAITSLDARLDRRRDSASESEQWATTLEQVGGKNEENQKRARQRFLEISDKYGSSVDLESAQTFRQFMLNQQALGLSLDAAAKKYETQTASFRGAGMTKEQQKRASYQLGQIQSKGKPEGADVNDLFDAAGVLAPYIRQAAADRLNFKGKVEEQAGWFKASVSDGLILAKDFDAGMTQFVKTNADIINKQNKSISANQTRAENDLYIQKQAINTGAEMVSSVNDRIKAERELVAAMQPVNAALGEFDIALMKAQTTMTRAFVDSDFFKALTNKKTTAAEDAAKPSLPSSYRDGGDIAKERKALGSFAPKDKLLHSQDVSSIPTMPVAQSLLENSLLGRALANAASNTPSMTLNPDLLRSLSSVKIPDSVLSSSNMPTNNYGSTSSVSGSHNVENSNNTVHQQFDIVITAPQGTSVQDLSSEIDRKIQAGAHSAIMDVFGAARAQQAERY